MLAISGTDRQGSILANAAAVHNGALRNALVDAVSKTPAELLNETEGLRARLRLGDTGEGLGFSEDAVKPE